MSSCDPDLAEPGVRLPGLDGGRNFRDLGGYPADDGRRVRWGLLYRSGSLAGLTAAGLAQFRTLGVRGICDLRTTEERMLEPNAWCAEAGVAYWARDHLTSFGELRRVMAADLPTGAAARAAMIAGYRVLPYEQAPSYAELFRRIAAGEMPLIFHCSAGKDRAGVAAALVLTALGVPRETVIEDYLLTNQALGRSSIATIRAQQGSVTARQPDAVIDAVFRADPDYIAAAFDAIAARSGSIHAYLAAELGLGPQALVAIRDRLLE